jgi:hypothetical protein
VTATALGQHDFVSRLGQQLVVFGSAFFGPRFDPAGARPHGIGGNQPQQFAFEGDLLTDGQTARLQDRRKGLQGVQRAFETLAGLRPRGIGGRPGASRRAPGCRQ